MKYRRGLALKKIIPQAIARDYTDLIVINEDRKVPNALVHCHLPNGPTAHYKISNVKFTKEIKVNFLVLHGSVVDRRLY